MVFEQLEADPASVIAQLRYRAEKRNAYMFFTTTLVFLLAWTPYAVISFTSEFSKKIAVPEFIDMTAAMLAKASSLHCPIIVACYDSSFRSYLKRNFTLRCEMEGPDLEMSEQVPFPAISAVQRRQQELVAT